MTKDGSTWTNKDILMYVDVIDEGMKTKEVSYDNKATPWKTEFTKLVTKVESGIVVTRNGIGMESVLYHIQHT